MKKEFWPYYASRATLSVIVAVLVFGFTWKAAAFTLLLWGMFWLYLHSGWFQVDGRTPLAPLRRDDRGRAIQRKALIAAVVVGVLAWAVLPVVSGFAGLPQLTSGVALALGVVAYFATQFVLFTKTG